MNEKTQKLLEQSVREYQQGFNDRQAGRDKRQPVGHVRDFSYNLGWHDGKPRMQRVDL